MIKRVKFYDGIVMNLSGCMARKDYTDKVTWLERCRASDVRKLWDFSGKTDITHTECVTRAHKLVEMVKKVEGVKAVWIRPMKSAPFFYTYVEDAFLTNGYEVVIPDEEYDVTGIGHYKFKVNGWWVIPSLTEDELEDD